MQLPSTQELAVTMDTSLNDLLQYSFKKSNILKCSLKGKPVLHAPCYGDVTSKRCTASEKEKQKKILSTVQLTKSANLRNQSGMTATSTTPQQFLWHTFSKGRLGLRAVLL